SRCTTRSSVPVRRLAVAPGGARGAVGALDVVEAPGHLGRGVGLPVVGDRRHLAAGQRLWDAVGAARGVLRLVVPARLLGPELVEAGDVTVAPAVRLVHELARRGLVALDRVGVRLLLGGRRGCGLLRLALLLGLPLLLLLELGHLDRERLDRRVGVVREVDDRRGRHLLVVLELRDVLVELGRVDAVAVRAGKQALRGIERILGLVGRLARRELHGARRGAGRRGVERVRGGAAPDGHEAERDRDAEADATSAVLALLAEAADVVGAGVRRQGDRGVVRHAGKAVHLVRGRVPGSADAAGR